MNVKTIYCVHNGVAEVCTMLNIKGIYLFIDMFNLRILAHFILSLFMTKVTTTNMKIVDSTADQFQCTQAT